MVFKVIIMFIKQLNRFSSILIFVLLLLTCGCSITESSLKKQIEYYRQSDDFQENISLEISYRLAFDKVLAIYKDLDITVLKQDYQGFVIIGTHEEKLRILNPGIQTPTVFFKVISPMTTLLTIKGADIGTSKMIANRLKGLVTVNDNQIP